MAVRITMDAQSIGRFNIIAEKRRERRTLRLFSALSAVRFRCSEFFAAEDRTRTARSLSVQPIAAM